MELKKQGIFFAFLIAILILSIGSISANDMEANSDASVDLGSACIDNGLNDEINNEINEINEINELNEINEINSIDNSPNENKSIDNKILKSSDEIQDSEDSISSQTQEDTENDSNPNETSKINTRISIEKDSIEKGSNLTIFLKDINGNPISNGKLTININNKSYTRTCDSNGEAHFLINLNSDNYTSSIAYEGSEIYESTSSQFIIDLYRTSAKINIANRSVVKERNLIIELLDKNGNPLKSQNINVKISNKNNALKTNSQGKASLKISLEPGKYKAIVSYAGDKNYNPISKSFEIKSYKLKAIFSIPKKAVIRGNYLYAYLKDGEGKAIASSKVTLKYNGKTYAKTTNKNGRIAFKISSAVGKYSLKLSYNGSKSNLKRSQTFTVQSYNIKTKFVVKSYKVVRGKYLQIYLRDNDNSNLPERNVIFTLKNKKYTRTTNANGLASLRLTEVPGTYSINLKFNGYNGYLKSNRNIKVNILKNTTASLLVKNQTRHLYGNKTIKYYITLSDNDGDRLAGETIRLKVKCNNITTGTGKTINKKTIVLSSDNIATKSEDKKLLNEMAAILRDKGYKVIVSGIGPNYHSTDVRDYQNVCVFSLVGGVDSGMFVDMASSYYQNYLKNYKNNFVLGCVAPPVYLNLGNMTWLVRAHDDDYSPASFKGLYYPGKYLNKVTKIDYVYGEDAEQLVENFLNYGMKGKSIDLGQSTPRTTNTYTLKTNKNGNVYIELPIGSYTITASVLNSVYKVDTTVGNLNIVQ